VTFVVSDPDVLIPKFGRILTFMLPEQKSQIEILQGGPIRVHLVFQAVLRLQLIGVDPQAKPPGLSQSGPLHPELFIVIVRVCSNLYDSFA
jgi:hypothetical protein